MTDEGGQRGFTLAEVLITLGIIGVVAAMTLPAVINNVQNKQLETSFKKSYSNFAQVTQRVILEDFGGQVPENFTVDNFNELVNSYKKYYINAKRCSGNSSETGCPVTGTSNFCTFMQNNYKNYNSKHNGGCIGNDALTNTVDGATIFFDKAGTSETVYGKIIVAIDVNGWNKKPNRWGHDIFVFQISSNNGKVLPMGIDGSQWQAEEYCSISASSTYNGYGCAVKAINEPDYFKNLPK